jgi:hypothetical protein
LWASLNYTAFPLVCSLGDLPVARQVGWCLRRFLRPGIA